MTMPLSEGKPYSCIACGPFDRCNGKDCRVDRDHNLTRAADMVLPYQRVEHPPHYTWLKEKCGIEVWDITSHMNFCLGNVIKYVLRHEHKGGLEDLMKARQYLNKEIERLS